jgi:hypothetical protein
MFVVPAVAPTPASSASRAQAEAGIEGLPALLPLTGRQVIGWPPWQIVLRLASPLRLGDALADALDDSRVIADFDRATLVT